MSDWTCTRRPSARRWPKADALERVRQLGIFENRPEVLIKMATRLTKGGSRLSFCYEAGPCGYGLHRLLTGRGHDCVVVAPSLIPMKGGDRVKTDRRDAMMLAKLHRAGELTPIWIPDAAHEAMRDLVRARATAVRVLSKARQHLQGFLLRHDRIYRGARTWTLAYRRWLTTVRLDRSGAADPVVGNIAELCGHAIPSDHAPRDFCNAPKIVSRARREMVEHDLLGSATAEKYGHLIFEFLARHQEPVLGGALNCIAKRPNTAGN